MWGAFLKCRFLFFRCEENIILINMGCYYLCLCGYVTCIYDIMKSFDKILFNKKKKETNPEAKLTFLICYGKLVRKKR